MNLKLLPMTNNFTQRYETISYAQRNMVGIAYDEAEKWLRANESKYLAIVNGEIENDIGTVENDNKDYSDRLAMAHCETLARYR